MKSLLSEKQRLRIQTRHKKSIEQFGYQPQALFWSDREIQQIRFEKLVEILPAPFCEERGVQRPWKILDVGCGFSDMRTFLHERGIAVEYCGLDLSEDMVQSARFQHPNIEVHQGDLFDFNPGDASFDVVFLSGALNEVVETEIEQTAQFRGRYAKAVIQRMYQACRFGVAFNLLDARHPWVKSRDDLQSFLPEEMVAYCQSFANKVSLQEGYLENDFTVYLHK